MAYREMDGERCTACPNLTSMSCRNCQRPLCRRHGIPYAFYVPVVECVAELVATCERLHGEAAERHRRELTRSPLGWVKHVPVEPC